MSGYVFRNRRGPLSRKIKQTKNAEFAYRDKELQKLDLIARWLSEYSDQTTKCKIGGSICVKSGVCSLLSHINTGPGFC